MYFSEIFLLCVHMLKLTDVVACGDKWFIQSNFTKGLLQP